MCILFSVHGKVLIQVIEKRVIKKLACMHACVYVIYILKWDFKVKDTIFFFFLLSSYRT